MNIKSILEKTAALAIAIAALPLFAILEVVAMAEWRRNMRKRLEIWQEANQ